MSGTLLVPLQVEARVLTAAATAPALRAAGDTPLPKGVHLHWALPDALVNARAVNAGGKQYLLFPSLPDLWLVVRFNPVVPPGGPLRMGTGLLRNGIASLGPEPSPSKPAAAAAAGPNVKSGVVGTGGTTPLPAAWGRGARAWVVEPRSGQKTNLGAWTPPPGKDPAGKVWTQAGLLDAADAIGKPGWGIYREGVPFEAGAHAYYPECQNRFGMHDPLDDLNNPKGRVSYCVIGWYNSPAGDPIAQTADPYALTELWKLLIPYESVLPQFEIPTQAVDQGESGGYVPVIKETKTVDAQRAAGLSARLERAPQAPRAVQQERAATLKSSLGDLAQAMGSKAGVVQVPLNVQRLGPEALACHGAVLDVALSGQPAAAPAGASVRVRPSLQDALPEVADTARQGDERLLLAARILGADQKLQRRASKDEAPDPQFIGLPNDVHALSFRGRPGASAWFAQITLNAQLLPWRSAGRTGPAAPATHPLVSASAGVSGYWPEYRAVDAGGPIDPKPTATLGPPTDPQVAAWMKKVQGAVNAINKPPAGSPKPAHTVHPYLVRVEDTRQAQDGGANAPGPPRGPEGSAYWVDVRDKEAMRALLMASANASVDMPSAQTLYEVPGPRWYRPYSPHVVLLGAGRSYRFGFDGRFEVDGWLRCRPAGDTLASLDAALQGLAPDVKPVAPVTGAQILGSAAGGFAARAGVPALARSLLEETLLLDADSAPDLAREWLHHFHVANPGVKAPDQKEVEQSFKDQITGNWILRHPELWADWSNSKRDLVEEALTYAGLMPSPVAFSPWQRQPWEPLFANVSYSFDPVQPGALAAVDVGVSKTPAGPKITGHERCYLSPVVSKVLDSAMVSQEVMRFDGKRLMPANQVDKDGTLTSATFLRMDVLSAALTRFDDDLFAAGLRLRGGTLRVDSVQVVDIFGSTLTLKPGAAPGTWQTELPPRLPSWARLQLRFMAADPAKEDDPQASPVCGYLVPDLLEHTLEVYDGDGTPLGQLVGDPPKMVDPDDPAPTPVPAVRFEAHPLQSSSGGPADVVTNLRLRWFVDGVCKAARAEVEPAEPGEKRLRESALTALLRVIDTLRSTVDPADKHGEHKVRMLGAPLALVRARLWLERTTGGSGDGPLLTDPVKDAVQIAVKVGAVAQQDDGVLGCFMKAQAADGSDAHFRPVDAGAVEKAILNGLQDAVANIKPQAVVHTFLHDPACADTTFILQSTSPPQELLLLLDIKGGAYLTSGVLPRKKLTLPRELLAGALRKLAPSFRVGPVLSFPADGQANPFLPPPALPGYEAQWIEKGQYDAEPLPQLPPDGVVPENRCTLTEGWLSMAPVP